MNAELFRALAVLAEPPTAETARVAAALGLDEPASSDYSELFLFQLYPYASVYTGAEGMLGGEARDRTAGFWRALNRTPPAEPDHLAVLLALYGELTERAAADDSSRGEAWHRARAALLWEHLLCWLPPYLAKLREVAPEPYAAWGQTLLDALWSEAHSTGVPASTPLHLLDAPPPLERIDAADDALQQLLAPIRSGVIVTRHDIAGAARELGLALRAGERRFALRALVEQAPRAVAEWLERDAIAWTERHSQWRDRAPAVADHWIGRARATAAAAAHLATAAA